MSHTPGPWKVQEFSAQTYMISTFQNGLIAQHVPGEANARLIAAAPELCEALEHVQAIISQSTGVAGWHLNGEIAGWDELGLREEIDGVLAKARGGLFDEAEYRHLLEDKKANKLSPQEEERLIQLYEEGEVDDIPSVFLRPEVEQKMDSLIEKIGELIQGLKARGDEGEDNA